MRRRVFDPRAPSATSGCPLCSADLSWVTAADLRPARVACRCHGFHPGINQVWCRVCKKQVVVKGVPGDLWGLGPVESPSRKRVTDAEHYVAHFARLDRE